MPGQTVHLLMHYQVWSDPGTGTLVGVSAEPATLRAVARAKTRSAGRRPLIWVGDRAQVTPGPDGESYYILPQTLI